LIWIPDAQYAYALMKMEAIALLNANMCDNVGECCNLRM
jgi:uncharacterized protein YqgQ